MSDVAARIAAASGDAGALLALAIELAQEVARLKTIETAVEERKRAAADKKYRQRHGGVSRDVPGHEGTAGDSEGPPPTRKERVVIGSPPVTPNGVSRPASRRARPRSPAESWVSEGVALWESWSKDGLQPIAGVIAGLLERTEGDH